MLLGKYEGAFGNMIDFIVMWIQKFKSPQLSKKYLPPSNSQTHDFHGFTEEEVNKTK